MPCLCGSQICRRNVLNILDLTPVQMACYKSIGAVPEFSYKYWLKNQPTTTAHKEFG